MAFLFWTKFFGGKRVENIRFNFFLFLLFIISVVFYKGFVMLCCLLLNDWMNKENKLLLRAPIYLELCRGTETSQTRVKLCMQDISTTVKYLTCKDCLIIHALIDFTVIHIGGLGLSMKTIRLRYVEICSFHFLPHFTDCVSLIGMVRFVLFYSLK